MMPELSRRKFFTGLAALTITAPAIVRAVSLMPVKVLPADLRSPVLITGWDSGIVSNLDVLYGKMHVRPEWNVALPEISMDELSAKILKPMIDQLSEKFANSIMTGSSPVLLKQERLWFGNA